MMINTTDNTYIGTPPYPWDQTAPTIEPEQPPWKTNPLTTGTGSWPPPAPTHPADEMDFEEFVIWACGFTDPDSPPSQKKWEEFQKKVQQLAADFVEYKRAKREREYTMPYTVTTSGYAANATSIGATGDTFTTTTP